MTVLYKNDLETANSLAALNALDNEEESAQKLIEAISNFIEESNFKLKGDIPSPTELPTGCSFHTRCLNCMELCNNEVPNLKQISENHEVACFLNEI